MQWTEHSLQWTDSNVLLMKNCLLLTKSNNNESRTLGKKGLIDIEMAEMID